MERVSVVGTRWPGEHRDMLVEGGRVANVVVAYITDLSMRWSM